MKLLLAASLLLSSALPISAHAADEPPLTLTISRPDKVIMGNPIVIHSVVKNVSDRTIAFAFGWGPATVLILDESGREMSADWSGRGGSSSLMAIKVEIKPGATSGDSPARIDSLYNLFPGKYSVQFGYHVDPNDPESPIVKSNAITITVLSPSDRHR